MKKHTPERISFFISVLLILFFALFFVVASFVSSTGYSERTIAYNFERLQTVMEAPAAVTPVIVLDAGHGGEDPGAVVGSISEKEINLSIALKVLDFCRLSDIDVVMTRNDDRLLYNDGQENRKKFYDLANRLAIAEGSNASLLVSIHQNKFPLESCHGAQVFYGITHASSKKLAESIRCAISALQTDNKRVIKEGSNIYLLENASMPAVIVECGFLSNQNDAAMLTDDEYTDKLAFLIYQGILTYLEEVKSEG